MTTKAAFNADEWAVVASAPALTGMLVVSASRGGTLRESVALSRAYAEARAAGPSRLLSDLLSSPPPAAKVAERPRSAEELERHVLDQLRRAIAILGRVASYAEVAEYKRFVYTVAEAVANAHKEGGFLGVGGTRVSDGEQAVLDKVAALFDATDVPPLGETVADQEAPEGGSPAPEGDAPAPADGAPAPEGDATAPEGDAPSPADDAPAPEGPAPSPADDARAPADDARAPAHEEQAPVGRWAPPTPGG